ncbi:copper-translocating P-type ATPase [Halogeometricum sp. S1BR25-6]|uniref:Copper-translocating P-type ATPase n=2 Tax=Halogeometricum salsisoli TaxID=2950536 RepID=A0ABU2GJU7_9EURY|nr:copper-translocating P-type ATPase [Halogeometricum sp. S1BR25-6]MDS0301064.1 copper-translocating P-type ATPase [Halogeometricum sp. S1BR25-6]
MFKKRFFVSLLLSIPALLFSEGLQALLDFSVPAFPGSEWISPVFAVIVFAYGGVPFIEMAVPELRSREPGMMTLISMAIIVSFVYSLATVVVLPGMDFFWELVTLIDIMLLGHWIEMRSVRQASGALGELAKLLPDTAERLTDDGGTEEVPVTELEEGDVVLVRPGASVPADGVVKEGDSDVNESMITGESRPVSKEAGEEVIGGTINGEGSLRVRVVATGDDSTLSGIMRLVEEAQTSKSRTQMLADEAAGWLFYVALAAAAVTAVGWTIAVGFNVEVIERMVTVLIIACPHALGLAIPLVVAINTSLAARNGMLIRDRIAMEEAREVDVVVFDKTGTLTEGEQGVVAVETVSGIDENDALALTAAIEGDSEHMIARSIRQVAVERDLVLPETSGFEAIKGRGVRATIDGETVHVGGPNLLDQFGIEPSSELTAFAEEAGANAQTVVYLVRGGEAVAAIALADVVREESRQAVEALHEMGIEVAMLTGDSEDVARAVARDLGIDTYFAEVLPEDKDKKIVELQEQGKNVAMVGDGVNDAPALTRADIGIAIGSGTDVAVEAADIILVQNNPLDVVRLVRLSRKSYRKMQENLVWAAGYNVFAIPLAAGVLAPIGILLSPAIGAILMSLSTVIVAVNAQLLRRVDLSVPSLPETSESTNPARRTSRQ